MAANNRIMARSKPTAGAVTTIYTLSGGVQANINIFVANQANSTDRVYIALTKSGNILSNIDYIVHNMPLQAYDVFNFPGISLSQGDMVTVFTTYGNCSFNVTGVEFT